MNEARKAEAIRNFDNNIMAGVEVVDMRGAGEL
jgi:hypothetical protein